MPEVKPEDVVLTAAGHSSSSRRHHHRRRRNPDSDSSSTDEERRRRRAARRAERLRRLNSSPPTTISNILGGTPGTHLATDHEDTSEGAVHCFQVVKNPRYTVQFIEMNLKYSSEFLMAGPPFSVRETKFRNAMGDIFLA